MNNKKKVLIVDDDNNLRKVLIDQLNISGFETYGAQNGEEGLQKALEIHPNVILLDIQMPKMDGWQVLEKLRADAWGKDAKVMMLTSSDQMDNVAHAMESSVYTYIVKSNLKLEDIVEKIKGTGK
jgi:two-component system response regulator AtoC